MLRSTLLSTTRGEHVMSGLRADFGLPFFKRLFSGSVTEVALLF